MRKASLLSLVAAAWAEMAHAQDAGPWARPDCADVERGSLEAELLDCDRAVPPVPLPDVEALEDLPLPEAVEDEPEPFVAEEEPEAVPEPLPEAGGANEPVVVVEEEVVPEPLPLPDAEPLPEPVVIMDEEPEVEPEPSLAPEAVVVGEPDDYPSDAATEDWIAAHPVEDAVEPVQARPVEVRREEPAEIGAGEGSAEDRAEEDRRGDDGGGEDAQALRIPNGHRPPPGSCRVWFPDRPPGHQPPPGSCDVEVPAGAVLIRG